MTTMDVGDRVNVQYLAYAAGVATTATVALTVTAPDGTTSTPTVTPTAPNIYDASFALTAVGTWSWRWDVSGTVTDIVRGEVYAGDPAPALYVSLARLKFTLNIDDLTRDDLLTEKLDSASRSVEKYCDDRRFYLDSTASVRTYSTAGRIVQSHRDGTERLRVDSIGADAASIAVEVGDGTAWTALTGFETYPDNALARLEAIEWLVALNCEWSRNRRVRVTARWGWPAIPTAVAEATLLQASRLFRRKDSPEGVAGNSDWGLVRVPNLDPDVKAQLAYLHSDFLAA